MFNLGFPELIALGALALIVIGPKQLPEVAKVLARTINELKRATKDLSGTLTDVKSEVTSSVDSLLEDVPTSLNDVEDKIMSHLDPESNEPVKSKENEVLEKDTEEDSNNV